MEQTEKKTEKGRAKDLLVITRCASAQVKRETGGARTGKHGDPNGAWEFFYRN